MPSPSFCRLCQCPLVVESASGLCATCLRTADTTLANPPATPDAGAFPVPLDSDISRADATTTAHRHRLDAPTGSVLPTDATRTHQPDQDHTPSVRLPESPPGYDLLSRLGGGGMGDVFLAHAHIADRLVAMKFLRFAGNHSAQERFLKEVRTLAALDHPNIIRVLSDDFLRSEPYFTAEYAAGGTLGQWIESHGPLDPRDAARLIAAVARAIAVAHAQGILHRDIKPSNILLASGGQSATPKLQELIPKVADFGLAKRIDEESMTVGSGPIGTPNYMPPEQISKKNGEVGPASDVYGLGSTLYFLLTGQTPYGSGDTAETMYRVLTDPVPRPRKVRPDLPADLDGIVVKCLEKEPTARYPSALALAEDLEVFLSGKNVVAPRQTVVRRARRWVGRQRLRLAAAGLMLAAVVAIASFWPRNQVSVPPDPVAEMQRELAAGNAVTLIDQTGLPRRWHRWALGGPELTVGEDGTCQFEAVRGAMLELLPDPGIDRYRVTLDLRLLAVRGARDEKGLIQAQGGMVVPLGFYFGYSAPPTGDRVPARFVVTVSYNDYLDPNLMLKLPAQPELRMAVAQVRSMLIVSEPIPGRDAGGLESFSRPLRFLPASGLPAEWRRVRVDVTPSGAKVFWSSPTEDTKMDAAMTMLADLSAAELDARYANMRSRLERAIPGSGVPTPLWSPRMPVGVWCSGGAVAVRSVIVEPLP